MTHHSAKFSGHRPSLRGDTSVLVIHMTSRDYVVKVPPDIMNEFSSSYVATLQRLTIIDLVEEETLSFQFVT